MQHSDIQVIDKWQECQRMAADLGMQITLNAGSQMMAVSGTAAPAAFKGFFSTHSVHEMAGFLAGIQEAKRVLPRT